MSSENFFTFYDGHGMRCVHELEAAMPPSLMIRESIAKTNSKNIGKSATLEITGVSFVIVMHYCLFVEF
jgi:hypothetical protein